ncbi:unnamed protein product [Strongylus vulgaris]|uniref:Uncharacterized protein n=1 Tax=Strongylus vulgaris TaxID=40348 RepID=A0A3P7JUQ0_STRVU|nr:unnamed protein product [Strongylus vulgaris]
MDELRTMGAQGLVANAGIFHNDKLLEKLGYRIMAEAIDGAVNNSIRASSFEYDDNTLKTQLVYKEMWRGEDLGTRIVI